MTELEELKKINRVLKKIFHVLRRQYEAEQDHDSLPAKE